MSFELLSEPIRKYIRDKRWESLRPIQVAAIQKILATDQNYILASRTASGKTEAAFLPILSKLNFKESGVQVLYISPLIALINDQFFRIEELCKNLDIEVTKWHGEASKTQKVKLTKNPRGIVLITPESLEAMLVNAPYKVKALFSNLKYVVIDEIHSFIGTDRGVQLQSILSRIQQINPKKFTIIGLSATIGDYDEAKRFTGDENNTKVLLDRTAKEMETHFKYVHAGAETELPLELLKDLYVKTKDNRALIFPNSRGRAEEVAVKLKKISERLNGHPNYFSHHSSIHKESREYIEDFAKNNKGNNFCIACTSTLELGIDIGTVDQVIQIDTTHSIASLIQRVGRSGRKEGEKSILYLYSTEKWSLLQSLACWLLYQEGYIEPIYPSEKPYDVLLHQMLSIVKQKSGCSQESLMAQIEVNFAFSKITKEEVEEIINHLIKIGLIELFERELIIGIKGEKIVNSRNFYSVFQSDTNFKVVHSGKTIGQIPFSIQINIDENIMLSARIWKIIDIDTKSEKIEVIPAKDAKKPLYFGTSAAVHPSIRQKMLEILTNKALYPELDDESSNVLKELRKDFSNFPIHNLTYDRPILYNDLKAVLYTFQGTKVNRSINFLLNISKISTTYTEPSSQFEIPINHTQARSFTERLKSILPDIDNHIESTLKKNPSLIDFSKWANLLPLHFQVSILKERYFDFDVAGDFLRKVRFVTY